MRIAVFGTGAVGGYFGGRLAEAGEDVTFIARGATLRALNETGLRIDSIKGNAVIHPVKATDDPAAVGPVDAVLLGVKAAQVPEAAQAIQPMLGPESFVVPLQNGVEAPAQLAAALGERHAFVGLCKIIAAVATPGHIRHTGAEPSITFGELDNRVSERALRLRDAFQRAGVAAEIPPDALAALWEKMCFVSPWGAVGAVTRAPIGVVRELPACRELLETAIRETCNVARGQGVPLDDAIVTRTMAQLDALPPGATTSMQRDIMSGRPSELESQVGATVRLGREAAIDTPVNRFAYAALLPQEKTARGKK